MKRLVDILDWGIVAVEVVVSVGLVIMAIGAVAQLAIELTHMLGNGVALPANEFNVLIGTVLEVFVVVELFRIAVAYMRHENVIPTVLEAALVAVARKFVVFEGNVNYLAEAAGLAALLLAVALSWYLLERANVTRPHVAAEDAPYEAPTR